MDAGAALSGTSFELGVGMGQISIGVDIGKTGHYVIALDEAGGKARWHELLNQQADIDEFVSFTAAHRRRLVD